MISTIGMQLIASAVLDKLDIQQFHALHLESKFFVGSELETYEAVVNHLHKYGVMPTLSLAEKMGIDTDNEYEPPTYYLEQIENRYLHQTVKKSMLEAQAQLKVKNPVAAFEIISALVLEQMQSSNRAELVNFTASAFDMIKKEYTSKQLLGDNHGIKTGWKTMDDMGSLTEGDLMAIVGRPACLSGDTKVYVSRKNKGSGRYYTVAELYRGHNGMPAKLKGGNKRWDLAIPTKAQSLMGDITGLNLVEQVIKCGLKETWTLVTASGFSIDTTLDHLFLTEGNTWLELRDLQQGMNVVVKAPYKTKQSKYTSRKVRSISGKFYETPYPTKIVSGIGYQRVVEYRAIFDAALNGLTLNAFIKAIKKQGHGLVFSPEGLHIHHKDHNPCNNHPSNLEGLSNSEHGKLHCESEKMSRRFGRNEVMLDKVISITYKGKEMTYDLVMADPYNNFVANDFVVHNSGKTYKGLYMAEHNWRVHHKVPMFVSMEMKPLAVSQRLASMYTHKSISQLKKGEMSTKTYKGVLNALGNMPNTERDFWIVDGNLAATVDDIVLKARQLKPDVVYVDGAYLVKSRKNLARWERVTETCEELKQRVATDLGIPIIASYQFNRQAVESKNGGALDHIAGADAVGQIASVVIGLFQEEGVECIKEKEIRVLKGRNGETGSFSINWLFDEPSPSGKYMDFSEITKEELEKEDEQDLGWI